MLTAGTDLHVTDSMFEGLGSEEVTTGGGISSHDSNLTMSGCTFDSNKAVSGAGVYLECDFTSSTCAYDFEDSTFQLNEAATQGGAVFYQSYKPQMRAITLTDNTAPYGSDLASYPVQIVSDIRRNL